MGRASIILVTGLHLLAVLALLTPSLAVAEGVYANVQAFPSERFELNEARLVELEVRYRDEFEVQLREHLRSRGKRYDLPPLQSASRLVSRNGITLGLIRTSFTGKQPMLSIVGYEAGMLYVVKCDEGSKLASLERGPCAQKIAETFGVVLQDSERP